MRALLLLHANEVVRLERLVDELWGEQPPSKAQAALHNHVPRLRKALGLGVLARREWGYVVGLRTEIVRLDEASLDHRLSEGIDVSLLWNARTDQVSIALTGRALR